ncbi:uncharacterized protein MONBRDRAFT_16334 [Monosiga brevicollis MX1]|uniref:inosine/xanthosine triphosphatase n=1 Tax=Monosiga brevicollis TaxID=81824 RepID=A9UWV3_MONBE|nr:uncharacterized protein MONBRDRAFT_16334 [Monosiga brevicollis MX1]EDQ90280.1 predicted protein [Monosiga brevicollis MX1]|eukprot:XP_001745047.1 hypothetical protein [Monosiga brevicollis MX1]
MAPIHVVVGSTNPVKAAAVKAAFTTMFPDDTIEVSTVNAPSGVADQPMGDDETLTGARNRTRNALELAPGADYYCGLEGGCGYCETSPAPGQTAAPKRTLTCFAWMAVLEAKTGIEGKAKTGTFELPARVQQLVEGGMELGHANDEVFKTKKSKQGGGAVGLLTSMAVTRTTYYEQALMLALIPFNMRDLYGVPESA